MPRFVGKRCAKPDACDREHCHCGRHLDAEGECAAGCGYDFGGEPVLGPRVSRLERGPTLLQAGGNCYEASGEYFTDVMLFFGGSPTLRLCHGEVVGAGGRVEGVHYGHAWLEDGDEVIDVSTGRVVKMPRAAYYAAGQIEDNVHRYTLDDVRRWTKSTGNWGPWELQTRTGL